MTNAEHLYPCRVPGRTYFIKSLEACVLFVFVIRTPGIIIGTSIGNISFIIIKHVHV